jgi:Ca2+-binding RTX toxin-like protein
MTLLRSVTLAALTAALVVPATASAASVSNTDGQIRYESARGERNGIIVSEGSTSGEIGFTENSPADLRAGAGCTDHSSPTVQFVTCTTSGVAGITIDLGDRDDRATLFLGRQPIPVVVSGGSGRDEVGSSGVVTLDGMPGDGPAGIDNYGADLEAVTNANAGSDDSFTGNAADNRLESPGGSDNFNGLSGDDLLITQDVLRELEDNGQVPPDRVTCGAGNDVALVDDLDAVADDCETVIRRDGVARLTEGDDIFRAPRSALTIFGLGGNDDIAAGGATSVSGGAGHDRITLGSAVDITARGDSGNDRVYGLVGRDRIMGGSGHDKLYGERSNDRIDGGSGRDGINAGRGDDVVRVRDGQVDRVKCSSGRDVVVADREDRIARDCERVRRG